MFVQTGATFLCVNMEKHTAAVCALIFSLGAYVHLNTVFTGAAEHSLTAKPGVCPRRRWGSGMCAEFCSNDSDCPGSEKCCYNGCGHECIAPYTVKPGRCALPQGAPMCAEYCYHDGQCPGEQKCCRTTCGHACSEPC
nr:WAP four-disulfide core domain protein 5-like isoform X2 [Monopterus albus]